VRRQRKIRGSGPCQDPPEVILAVLHRSTAWFTYHPQDSLADPHSSGVTAHSSSSSRQQLGHHSRSRQWGTHATTVGRLGTSPRSAACQGRPTHLVLQLLWLPSRRASREAQRSVLVVPTTPQWRRYPQERKLLRVRFSSMSIPS
jgi:hypothetical protein